MILKPQDAATFFKLMPGLQVYANQKLGLVKNLSEPIDYRKTGMEDRVKLRDTLYEKHPELIRQFVNENPFSFTEDELEIVAKWENFVSGEFYVIEATKKYTFFMQNEQVYAVLGLIDSIVDMVDMPLPFYTKAILLPFKGKIIYDGLLQTHSIMFGAGIRASIDMQYKTARSKGLIRESLDPDWQPSQPKNQKDWKPVLAEIAEKASKLRSSSDEPPLNSPAFSLVKASLDFAQTAIEHPQDAEKLFKSLDKVFRSANKAEKLLYYID